MSTNYPGALDTLVNPTPTDTVAAVDHAAQHANANDAIEALEAKVGATASVVQTSHDYKLSLVTGAGKAVPQSQVSNVDNTSDLTKNAAVATLTNKTINADNNNITNVEVADFKPSAIVTEAEGIAGNDNDTTLPTSAAVKDYVDANVGGTNIKVRAYNSASQNASTSPGKVTLNTEAFDTAGVFASSTFTVPQTGYYLVIGRVLFTTAESTHRVYCVHIYVNGAAIAQSAVGLSTTPITGAATVSDIVYLTLGNTVELYQSSSASSHTNVVQGGAAGTCLSITKLP